MDDLPKVGTIICFNVINLVNSCVLPAVSVKYNVTEVTRTNSEDGKFTVEVLKS